MRETAKGFRGPAGAGLAKCKETPKHAFHPRLHIRLKEPGRRHGRRPLRHGGGGPRFSRLKKTRRRYGNCASGALPVKSVPCQAALELGRLGKTLSARREPKILFIEIITDFIQHGVRDKYRSNMRLEHYRKERLKYAQSYIKEYSAKQITVSDISRAGWGGAGDPISCGMRQAR